MRRQRRTNKKNTKNKRGGNGSCLRELAGGPRVGSLSMLGTGPRASTGQAYN